MFLLSVGFFYLKMKDFDHALADYNRAMKLNPKYAAAFGLRGDVYLEKGLHDQAIEDYDRAIKLDPHDAITLNSGVSPTLRRSSMIWQLPTMTGRSLLIPMTPSSCTIAVTLIGCSINSTPPLPILVSDRTGPERCRRLQQPWNILRRQESDRSRHSRFQRGARLKPDSRSALAQIAA